MFLSCFLLLQERVELPVPSYKTLDIDTTLLDWAGTPENFTKKPKVTAPQVLGSIPMRSMH